MPVHSTSKPPRRRLTRLGALVGTAVLGASPLVVLQGAASASASPVIRAASIPNYSSVLENHASRTLYALSTERGAKLHCTATCLSTWLPLVVPAGTKSISVASSVKGKIGFVARSKAQKQVTVNTFPVYTFKGDTGTNQSNGEAFAGQWFMLHAGATTGGAALVAPLLQSGTSGKYAKVLQDKSHLTLYVLSIEKGASVHCKAACLANWPPLLVTASTTHVAEGAGVKGSIGFVTRGSMQQVTFNTYPVYTYAGDTGPNQTNGENFVADGGTWLMASSPATTAAGTPVLPK